MIASRPRYGKHFGSSPAISVAASNASNASKSKADYVCGGTDDQDIINAAIQSMTTWTKGTDLVGGGAIELSEGLFTITDSIVIDRPITFAGQGATVTGISAAVGSAFHMILLDAQLQADGITRNRPPLNIIEKLYMTANMVAAASRPVVNGVDLTASQNVTISTAAAHGLTTGTRVTFHEVGGTTWLNGREWTITEGVDVTHFTLDYTDGDDAQWDAFAAGALENRIDLAYYCIKQEMKGAIDFAVRDCWLHNFPHGGIYTCNVWNHSIFRNAIEGFRGPAIKIAGSSIVATVTNAAVFAIDEIVFQGTAPATIYGKVKERTATTLFIEEYGGKFASGTNIEGATSAADQPCSNVAESDAPLAVTIEQNFMLANTASGEDTVSAHFVEIEGNYAPSGIAITKNYVAPAGDAVAILVRGPWSTSQVVNNRFLNCVVIRWEDTKSGDDSTYLLVADNISHGSNQQFIDCSAADNNAGLLTYSTISNNLIYRSQSGSNVASLFLVDIGNYVDFIGNVAYAPASVLKWPFNFNAATATNMYCAGNRIHHWDNTNNYCTSNAAGVGIQIHDVVDITTGASPNKVGETFSRMIGTVYAKTANTTVQKADSGRTYTNTGVSGAITFALPAALVGMWYRFVRIDLTAGYDISLDPSGSEIIYRMKTDHRFTFNPADLADGAGETTSQTVTGAALGDIVLVSAPYDLEDLIVTCYVQSANTVEARLQNENAGANVDLEAGTWQFEVQHRTPVSCGAGKKHGNHVDVDQYYEVTIECFKTGEWMITSEIGVRTTEA